MHKSVGERFFKFTILTHSRSINLIRITNRINYIQSVESSDGIRNVYCVSWDLQNKNWSLLFISPEKMER